MELDKLEREKKLRDRISNLQKAYNRVKDSVDNNKETKIKITFKDNYWWKKGDVLNTGDSFRMIVTKVYERTWWKRFLSWLGFKVIWYEGVKVKEL